MNEKAQEIIAWHVENGRKAELTDHQLICCIRQSLEGEGLLRDPDEVTAERDPLASTIQWSTDVSKPPTVTNRTHIFVLRWCSEFRMECQIYAGIEIAEVFARYAEISRPIQADGAVYEALVPKEFAWGQTIGWPPAAHEAIAARLQAEADRFARQAKEARGMAA